MVSMEAVLLDAEDRQETSHQIQLWLRKIKLVLYDVEDLLQEVTTEALKHQVETKIRKRTDKVLLPFSRPNTINFRLQMGGKVKLIRERLDVISLDSKRFNFTERQSDLSALRSKKREETHSFVPVDKFIGREEDKKYVTKLLVEPDVVDNVSVISVVGIGGLGKTTLVQSIYHSEEVKENFDLTMWVCVSDPFDVKLICENIIESATNKKCKRPRLDGVIDELKKAIDGRKYLLVLDDVWNDKHIKWLELEVLLRGGARGSKILITTRSQLVAQAAKSTATHVLKGFSPQDSWDLFKQVAFKREGEQVSPTIKEIGKEVVEKCVGVPLVIKAIGSMLAVTEREIDWLDFKKNDLVRVTQDSAGSVLPSLRLSYDYLSAPLKRCFAYCAIYPKDYKIDGEELIGMWMAHGLIQLDGTTRSLEDVGEHHLKDLLNRSFFELHEYYNSCDHIMQTWYQMHDLIHDLAQSVGGSEYYNPGSGAKFIDESTRHARVSVDELTNLCHGQKLRTLVVTKSFYDNRIPEIVITSEQLRVLSLAFLGLKRVPQFVGGSRHLNYLNLSGNSFVSLPESVCSLYNLQTLVLWNCTILKELPAGTRDLVSLRHLDVRGCGQLRCMPCGMEDLTCLQTLGKFVTGGGSLEEGEMRNYAEMYELEGLVNLRGSLEIVNLRGFKCVKCYRKKGNIRGSKCEKCERNRSCIIIGLKFIQQLKLEWGRVEEEEEGKLLMFKSLKPHPNLERLIIKHYQGSKFPSWMDRVNIGVSLPNIVYIQLEDCRGCRHLPALGLLPCLQQLHLDNLDSVEYLIDCSSSSSRNTLEEIFPSLKELSLIFMHELKRLVEPSESSQSTTNKQYFPVLEKLEIDRCRLFLADGRKEDVKQFVSLRELCLSDIITETLPSWLQYLPHLQTLKLFTCTYIVSLPEWMGNLTSLQQLHLEYFRSLASIPDCVQSLTSLQRLRIYSCPKLPRRCEKETGADWHKIKHIPNITVWGDDERDDELMWESDFSGEESEDSSSVGEAPE